MESQAKSLMFSDDYDEAKPKPKNILTNFLVVYFDCAYFLFLSPFRFVHDDATGRFVIRKSIPQFLIYALQNGLALLYIIFYVRADFHSLTVIDNTSPLKYFELLGSFLTYGFQVLTMKSLLFHQTRFLEIVNFIQDKGLTLPVGNIRIQRKIFIYLTCGIFAAMALYKCIWKTLLAPTSSWDKTIWNRRLVSHARYAFFLTNNVTELTKIFEPSQLSTLDYFLAFLGGLASVQIAILEYYPDLSLLFGVLTVWTAAYHFSRKLRYDMKQFINEGNWKLLTQVTSPAGALSVIATNSNTKTKSQVRKNKATWPEVYQTYQSVRELCQLFNEAFGSIVTVYLANTLVYQATGLDNVLTAKSIIAKMQLLFFIGNSTMIFLLSADACDKLETLKVWLAKDENRQDVSMDQLNLVLGELRTRDVGIRGSNIFTITYPLLWNVLTTVVTYFIICLQSRQQIQEDAAEMVADNCTHRKH